MRIEVYESYADMSNRAAELVAGLLRKQPDAVLGLPTGSTPEAFYASLVKTGVSFRSARTFNLDEYVGLPRQHPQSYYSYMKQHLFDHVDLAPENAHIPDGMAADAEAECRRYEEELRTAGGLDVVLLGIGHNGHIGFNEPGTPWNARTRRVALTQRTRDANARFFGNGEKVPTEALTMGMGTIMEARQIILLASGESKAEIVRRTLEGEIGVEVPSTALRVHSDVVILLDRGSASLLRRPVA